MARAFTMLISGFVDGRLIYIIRFPFSYREFAAHLKSKLDKFYGGTHQTGRYLRSAEFNYKHYHDCPDLSIVYLDSGALDDYPHKLSEEFKKFVVAKHHGRSR